MIKRRLSLLVIATFFVSPLLSLSPAPAQAATINSLIKGSGPTAYWYASNGRRYVFPNTKTFHSWFSIQDFSRIQTVSDSELYLLPLGGNVTYRPGAKLVKVVTDPKVYAVSRYGTLRWVTSEYLAQTLYGSNWRQWVEDVPDEFFTNYVVGSAIYGVSDYSVSDEYSQIQTPSDDINSSYYGYGSASYLSANTSVSLTTLNQYQDGSANVQVTVSVWNLKGNTGNISGTIYDERDNSALSTFTNCVPSCSANAYVTVKPGTNNTFRYYTVLRDQSGNQLPTVYSSYLTAQQTAAPYNPPASSNGGSLTITPSYTSAHQNGTYDLTVHVNISNLPPSVQGMVINIFAKGGQTPLATCLSSTECTYRVTLAPSSTTVVKQYFATLLDPQGNLVNRQESGDIVFYPLN